MATHQHLDRHATHAFAAWLRRTPGSTTRRGPISARLRLLARKRALQRSALTRQIPALAEHSREVD